jgi:hypothetical protein
MKKLIEKKSWVTYKQKYTQIDRQTGGQTYKWQTALWTDKWKKHIER